MSSKKHRQVDDVAITDGCILRILEGIDTPRSLAVWLLYKYNEHNQLVSIDTRTDCEPVLGLRNINQCQRDYVATELLSKADFLRTGINLEEVAIGKFQAAETSCREANRRLNQLDSEVDPKNFHLLDAITRAKIKIANLLGEFDPQEFIESVNWGPGATVQLSRKQRLAYDKFRLEAGMSPNCLEFWSEPLWRSAFPRWTPERQPQMASLLTVPKNSKTDRCIINEPGINTFLQLGLGKMVRRRLAKIGIRLRSQAELHQSMIAGISKTGEIATVDFQAASDTVCTALVRELLPDRWYAVFAAHRSGRISLPDGSVVQLEKFSSMGNGYTFELETLIFWALARAICDRDEFVSVYGDDVLLPSTRLESYRELCAYVGLTLNARKSFNTGYFRESCGAHSFNGYDAKPFYLRSRIRTILDIFKTANGLRRLANRMHSYFACDRRYAAAWGYLTGATIGRKFRVRWEHFYIPDGYGDFGLCVDFDAAAPYVRVDKRYQRGFRVSLLLPRFVGTREVDDYPLLLTHLFELERSEVPRGILDIKDRVGPWAVEQELSDVAMLETPAAGNLLVDLASPIHLRRKTTVYVPSWSNLGPWI